MLPPSMDYEVGKGRQYELEQKAAKRRLVEEGLAGKRQQHRGFVSRLVAFVARLRPGRRAPLPAGRDVEREEQFRERFAG